MEIEMVQSLIGSYGFPIAVTGYLLWERKSLIAQLTSAMADVRTALVELTATIKGGQVK